jgi:two-component system, chemotaxis family, chemotaxis protein CheY
MNFLVVDDSSTMRKIVTLALSGAGHSYREAGNGIEALEALKAAKADCILLDINMPEMNGIEFLKRSSADPALKGIPVIVLTTQDEEALRKEALSLGAKGFLAKPFHKEALLAAVKEAVGA